MSIQQFNSTELSLTVTLCYITFSEFSLWEKERLVKGYKLPSSILNLPLKEVFPSISDGFILTSITN